MLGAACVRQAEEACRTWPSIAATMRVGDVCFARTKIGQDEAKQINNSLSGLQPSLNPSEQRKPFMGRNWYV